MLVLRRAPRLAAAEGELFVIAKPHITARPASLCCFPVARTPARPGHVSSAAPASTAGVMGRDLRSQAGSEARAASRDRFLLSQTALAAHGFRCCCLRREA